MYSSYRFGTEPLKTLSVSGALRVCLPKRED